MTGSVTEDEGPTDDAAPADGLAAVCADVLAEGHEIDLAGAVRLPSADDQLVLRTEDGWVVRLPLGPAPDVEREAAALALVDGLLPVPVPAVAWTGRRRPMVAYRPVLGTPFDAAAYAAADRRTRDRLAASFARFLAVLHAVVPADAAAAAGVPRWSAADLLAQVEAHDDVPAGLQERVADVVEHFREVWVAEPWSARPVLLHGAFHPGNLVLDGPVGGLAGVWGFRHALVGPPSLDLGHLARSPDDVAPGLRRDLMQRVAEQYGRTGVVLDVDGARSAMAMADLAAGLAAGDLGDFEPDHGVWGWPGADRG